MRFDVVIIGAGPAGLAAARAASESDKRIAIIDENPAAGGQIWRGSPKIAIPARVKFFAQARVFDIVERFIIRTDSAGDLAADKLILATGARELFLPFPGWTLPGVFGAGGLQALMKCGLPVRGKRIVVAGSGPLLFAVGAALRGRGARVLAIVEQAPLARIRHFLTQYPRKLPYALLLRARLFGIPFHTGTWPVRFQPGRVTLSSGEELAADWLACGFGLVPNTEIAQLLGCRLDDGYVAISGGQQTSVEGVYCAGEPTGIGGLDKAIEEGERAGRSATGQSYRRRRTRSGAFVRDLATAYHLDGRLLALATGDTVVCRCEEVSYSTLAPYREWREAKLLTRCGMGACQGRICGPITNRLFGWTPGSVRPPLVPVSASLLLQQGKADSDHHDRDGGQ